MVRNLSSNTGDAGLIPGGETEIPQVAGQLNLSAATIEPMHHNETFHMMQLKHKADK